MTTTEIETEVEVAKETKTKSETQTEKPETVTYADVEALNEIAIAKSKQSNAYTSQKFEEVKSEYSTIEQNNTPLNSVNEINKHKTNNEVAYLPKKQNKNNYTLKNARIKNFIICASIVLCLSVGLVIYNAVQITLTNMQIASIETQISTGSANYESALKQLKKLTSAEEMQEQAIDLNMGEANQTISADLIETRSEINSQNKTNWFNKLCNFLSTMFK